MDGKLCRICCKNEATSYIFQKDYNDIDLSTKIMYCCAKLNIKEGDGLPSFVCEFCEQELEVCFRFALKCEASDKYLRSAPYSNVLQGVGIADNCILPVVKTEAKCLSNDEHDYEDLHNDEIPIEQLNQKNVKNTVLHKIKRNSRKRSKYKNVGPKKCSVCNRECANQSTLMTHMRTHTNEYLFPCTLCDKKYKDGGNLKRHMSRHHSTPKRIRNFICESCGKGFFSKSDVTIHMRTHTGETPYACSQCSAKYTQLGPLLKHKKRHSGEKDHLCSMCSKTFWSKQALNMHLIAHSTEKKYNCTLCKASFKYQSNLTKHKRLHSIDSRSFICNHCNRIFKVKGNLKLHIERQHSEKSGYCELCLKHTPNLEAHMWRHTGERPFKCESCTSTFYERKALARHTNFKHTKTDKYKCEFEGCVKMFPSPSMLKFHILKVHSTQVPFPCDHCTRAFYRKGDLVRHKSGTHKVKKE